MASLYAPYLTRWSVAMAGGVVHDCVEYEGKPLFFRREDCRRLAPDDEADRRECLEIGGKVFPFMDEAMVPVLDDGGIRKAVRCVEYVEDNGSVLLLTLTEGEEEVDARDGGEVRVVVVVVGGRRAVVVVVVRRSGNVVDKAARHGADE